MIYTEKALLDIFKEYWQKEIEQYPLKKPQHLYAPIHYIAQAGGKRMRPVFMLLAAQLFDNNIEKVLPAAYCIELFHNFTLLHDDIMDEAPLRRGRMTVHEKWDTNTAILSGDLMMIESIKYLNYYDAELRSRLSDYFINGAIAVCEGQQWDMDFEKRDDVHLDEYMEMIRLKTAALLAEGMAMAAACNGADSQEAEAIRQFGNWIGTAFQIQDDILDSFGDPNKFGKKVGGDIAQNKKTFLYLKTLELADEKLQKEFLYYYSNENSNMEEKVKIESVMNIFRQLNIREVAEKEKMNCADKAFSYLDSIKINEEAKEKLKNFSLILAKREN